MDAKIYSIGEVTIVAIAGKLSMEDALPFKKACLSKLKNQKLIFSLQDLSFVGSSGIQSLFLTMKDLNEKNNCGIKLAGVSKEFKRIMDYSQFTNTEIYEKVESALTSFEAPQIEKS